MNFRIIEGDRDIDEIYEEFKEDYLYSKISNPKLKRKYDLNKRDWEDITRRIKQENNIMRRPSHKKGKHYYLQGKSYAIRKYINGKLHHFGTVPTEEIAIKIVAQCEKLHWELDSCHNLLDKWYEYL